MEAICLSNVASSVFLTSLALKTPHLFPSVKQVSRRTHFGKHFFKVGKNVSIEVQNYVFSVHCHQSGFGGH